MVDSDSKVQMGAFSHPRRSSDLFVHHEKTSGAHSCAVSVVLDTIGRPGRGRIKKVFKRMDESVESVVAAYGGGDIEDADRRFREAMIEMNRFIRKIGSKQRGFFGFCFAATVRVDRSVKIHWMGDCRVYHFHRAAQGEGDIAVNCLTRDNNKLTTDMLAMDKEQPGIEVEMLKNEMLELSRRLTLYMGIRDEDGFAAKLEQQSHQIELALGEMLMITTDGILMPVIRHEVANGGFRLSMQRLYLEEWFEQYLKNGEYLRDFKGIAVWENLVNNLKSACLQYTRSRKRYRDDMAVIYMC